MLDFETLKKCPYCSCNKISLYLRAPDRLTNLPGIFSVYKCDNCGLIFQNPRVKESKLDLVYSNKLGYCRIPKNKKQTRAKLFLLKQTLFHHFNYPFFSDKQVSLKISSKIKNAFLKNFYFLLTLPMKRILLIKGFPIYDKNKSVLEIGCSNGEFLGQLRDFGWKTKGIEMGEESSRFAKTKRRLNVENKKIQDCEFLEGEFDCVIMKMVLEHLYNPFEVLKRVTKWLKPNSQLIFSIPYIKGFEFKFFGDCAYGLQLPSHLFFFNKRIIREYLKKLGYEKIKFYHHFFDRDIVASANYKYQDTKKSFYKFLAFNKFFRLFIIKPFVFLLSLLKQTSRVTIYARKI